MSNMSLFFSAAALAVTVAGAAPVFAQGDPPIRHMLVQYRPASGDTCADMASRDAMLRPSETRCDAEPGWMQQRLVMARR